MSEYVVTEQTDAYEIGVKFGQIIAACTCGGGGNWPDKGLGRAHAAAWKSRHVNCKPRSAA